MKGRTTAKTYRTTARVVGALFLTATGMLIIGEGVQERILGAPDLLGAVQANQGVLTVAALLTFVTAIANVLIGILLFPLLKAHDERIALGYAFTRFFDGAGVFVAGIGILSLVALGRQFAGAEAPLESQFQALASLIAAQSAQSFEVTMIVLGLGAMPFCYLLYRTRLIPRWMAALGFVGYASLFGGGLVQLFGIDLAMVHYLPGGIFEFVLPLWLIFRGFNAQSPVAAQSGAVGREGHALTGA